MKIYEKNMMFYVVASDGDIKACFKSLYLCLEYITLEAQRCNK